jgi:hypothetical protein
MTQGAKIKEIVQLGGGEYALCDARAGSCDCLAWQQDEAPSEREKSRLPVTPIWSRCPTVVMSQWMAATMMVAVDRLHG